MYIHIQHAGAYYTFLCKFNKEGMPCDSRCVLYKLHMMQVNGRVFHKLALRLNIHGMWTTIIIISSLPQHINGKLGERPTLILYESSMTPSPLTGSYVIQQV